VGDTGVNLAAAGKRYPEIPFVVDAERVEAFRRAVGGPPDGIPPTFPTAAEFVVFPRIVSDPDVGLDLLHVVHADQTYEYARPLVVGETLTIRSQIADVRERGALAFLVIRTELVGADGEVAVTATSTMLERMPA
jgi:N-terminal half of MaoC dehydratase